ncbi:MAG: Gfo/Idh/MocA family protein [Erysipelotrichaceae bacterium]
MNVGIIGLGDISAIHIAAIKGMVNANLVAVCDIDETKRNHVDASFYTDYHEMLAKETLDVVHICLPHHLHVQAAKDVIAAGIHVLLEKPVGLSYAQGKELADFAAQYPEVKASVCLQNRFNASFTRLQKELANPSVGKLIGMKGLVTWNREQNYYDAKPWRKDKALAGGGAMINQSVHTLDLLQLLGGTIASIKGMVGNLGTLDIEVEDTAVANIAFTSGARATYFVTTSYVANSSVELQVICEHAKFTIKDQVLYQHDEDNNKTVLIEDERLAGTKFYYGASHALLIADFYQAINQQHECYVSVADALASIAMIDAIQASQLQQKNIPFKGESHE